MQSTPSTQKSQLLSVKIPSSNEQWILTELVGCEALSQLYRYQLTLHRKSPKVSADKLIGQAINIKIQHNNDPKPRYIHGIINQVTSGPLHANGWRQFHVNVVPPLWFFSQNRDNRIFKNKTVLQIIDELMKENPLQPYEHSGIKAVYAKKNYKVQYQESTYEFIERLLAEEGIFFYFNHDKDKVTWVLGDQGAAYQQYKTPLIVTNDAQQDYHLHSWRRNTRYKTLALQQNDYQFTAPSLDLTTIAANVGNTPLTQSLIDYDYPGDYKNQAQGTRIADIKQQAREILQLRIDSSSNDPHLGAGTQITIAKNNLDSSLEKNFLVTSVEHCAKDNSILGSKISQQQSQHYENFLQLIPAVLTFRPQRPQKKPIIVGIDTAKVIGPANEAIYTDEFARIKVRYYWDKDNIQSCWIRNTQPWAGKNWGMQFIPRINDEVMLQFEDGNPERPIVIGSHFNGENLPAYPLPEKQSISGIKTHTLNSNNPDAYNELRFDNTPGKEEIHLHAFNNLTKKITHDETTTIANNQKVTSGNNRTVQHNKGNHSIEAGQSIEMNVGNSQLQMTPTRVTFKGNAIRLNDGPAKKPKELMNDVINLAGVGFDEAGSHVYQAEKLTNKKPIENRYYYYIVNYEGFRELLTSGFGSVLVDMLTNFNLADGFEEERWTSSIADTAIESRDTVLSNELDRNAKISAGTAGIAISALNFAYKESLKHVLLESLKNLHSKIVKMMPERGGGVLVEAGYWLFDDGNSQSLQLRYIRTVKSGKSYKPIIKKAMTGPFAITKPPRLAQWKFLFIWVTIDKFN